MRLAPRDRLGDDAGIPGTAGCGDGAGHIIGKDPRQDHIGATFPAMDLEIIGGLQKIGWIGRRAAMTLKRIYHWVPRIIKKLSQISG